MSQNIGQQLPTYTAQHTRRVKASNASQRNPKILQRPTVLSVHKHLRANKFHPLSLASKVTMTIFVWTHPAPPSFMDSFAKQLTGPGCCYLFCVTAEIDYCIFQNSLQIQQLHSFQNIKVPCYNLQPKSAHAKFPVPHFVIQILVTNTNLCLFHFHTDVTKQSSTNSNTFCTSIVLKTEECA
jgi:hypothetical protein